MEFIHLNIYLALEQLGGSQRLYKIILEGFEAKYGLIDEEIKSLSLRGQWEDSERLSHSVKGLCGNLGALQLQEYAKKLEFMYRSRSVEQEENILLQFRQELKSVVAEVSYYLAELSGAISEVAMTREYDYLETKSHIHKLMETLETHQYGGINKAYQIFKTIQFSEKDQLLVNSIKNAIESYEYVRAKEMLKSLLYPT